MRLFVYSEIHLFGQSLGASMRDDPAFDAVIVEHHSADLEEQVTRADADVVLFDVSSVASLEVLDRLASRSDAPPVVAIAVAATAHHVMACAQAGVYNMVHRDANVGELKRAVTRAVNGEVFCRPEVTRLLFDEIRDRRLASHTGDLVSSAPTLTPRESDVLLLLAGGRSNKQIARELHLSVSTVKKHVHSLFRKLHLERRSQARGILDEYPGILVSADSNSGPDPSGSIKWDMR